MAFTRELTGASGSFLAGTRTIGYTVVATGGELNSFASGSGDIDGTNYHLGNSGEPDETYTFTFDQPIRGVQINVNRQNNNETIFFAINGVDVNLNTLIDSGDVVVVATGNGTVDATGNLAGSGGPSGSVTSLQFNVFLDSIALTHAGGGGGSLVEVFASDVAPNIAIIEGTTGDDQIDGTFEGDPEGDTVDNNDSTSGGNDDTIIGGAGDDTISSGAENDLIFGDGDLPSGDVGADGNDVIDGGAGDDTINGGGGDDVIDGGAGDDLIAGDDVLIVDIVNSELTGASGSFVAGEATVNYTVVSTNGTVEDFPSGFGEIDGTNYLISNGTYTYSFDQVIDGVQINVNAQNTNEIISFAINGVDVDLNALIASGEVTVVATGNGTVDANGNLVGSAGPSLFNGTVTTLQFNTAVDSLSLTQSGTGSLSLVEVLALNEVASSPSNGGGNDTLIGGAGADTLIGGEGSDVVQFFESTAGVTIDLNEDASGNQQASGGDATGDILSDIENVYGSRNNDVITGNDERNILFGYNGDDIVDGGAGDDVIRGDAGADTLIGGEGTDYVRYVASTAGVTVDLNLDGSGNQQASGGDATGDVLSGFENVQGSDFDDVITGDAEDNYLIGNGGNDVIDGGAGADTIQGGAGADTLSGGEGIDILQYEGSTSGVTVDLNLDASGNQQASGGDAAGDVISGFETVYGSDFGDTITGDDQRNNLFGFDGDDFIDGGAQNDTIRGGAGADTLIGGDRVDLLHYLSSDAGVTVDLNEDASGLQQASGGHATGDVISEFENVYSSNFDDILIGNSGRNILYSYGGDDIIDGGDGNDVLRGGSGADTFVFTTALGEGNVDRITDFNVSEDIIQIDSSIFTGLTAGILDAVQFQINETGLAENALQRVIYDSNTGDLYFDRDGNGAEVGTVFATLSTNLTLDEDDFAVI